MRIIYMGTPEFAVPALTRLAEEGYRPLAVVTAPDRARGRGRRVSPTAVKKAAAELGISKILQPESVKDPAFAEQVRALEPDLIVVVAFRILPPAVFAPARMGAFNLHGSLLPRFRGAAPIHRAVMAGERETGVTTFFLKEKVDTGNIILARRMAIGPDETTGDVHDRMMVLGAEAVLDTVRRIDGGNLSTTPQNDALATPAPKVFREEGDIPWEKSAVEVHNHIRGLSPVPGAWTTGDGVELKCYRSCVSEGEGEAGTVLAADGELRIACGSGAILVTEVQAPGGRRLSTSDYLRGSKLVPGVQFKRTLSRA